MKTTILLLILTSTSAMASDKQATIDREISQYLHSITKTDAEYQRVDDILADTVLEGDTCERLRKGHITKRCKAELKQQAAYELNAK